MLFNDFTLLGGDIFSRRKQDSRKMAPEALTVCRQILKDLRKSDFGKPVPIPGQPEFQVILGKPDWLHTSVTENDEMHNRFFSVSAGDPEHPIQVNLLLPNISDLSHEEEQDACGTMLALSNLDGKGSSEDRQQDLHRNLEERVSALIATRPLLMSTVLPLPGLDLETVSVATHFSVCFAAVLLEE